MTSVNEGASVKALNLLKGEIAEVLNLAEVQLAGAYYQENTNCRSQIVGYVELKTKLMQII